MRVARFVLSRVVCVTSVTLLASAIIAVLALLAATTFTSAQTANPRDAAGPDLLSCSPAPCVLPPTQASLGPKDDNDAPIAADPSNPKNLIVGSNDYNCLPFESLGFFVSLDGGSDWSQVCMSGLAFEGEPYIPNQMPILGYDRHGTAYIGGYYYSNGDSGGTLQGVQKSSDSINWSTPVAAVVRQNYAPLYCWMAVDTSASSPYADSVYISCVMVGPPGQNTRNQVVVSRSNDGGATWQLANVAPVQNAPDQDLYTTMAVGNDGTVYLTWLYCNTTPQACDTEGYVVFSKSSDGGNTWSKPKLVAPVTLIYPLPNTESVSVGDVAAIAVDNSDGPHSDYLYVVMYNWTGTFMQVEVARSTDGGDNWSKPVPVAPGITHDQFLPWISVSPAGLVGASWLDRRNDPKNIDYQAYAGISADGGLSFQPNVQLTTAFSNPNVGKTFIGDYTGNTWDGTNYFVAAWMDESNEVNTQDFVGGIRLK
jgi:hypothetical protein